ncbi:alpha/beta fold hydrolase [Polaromonas sp. JS666]|uniref:alpha/beta fold hydrolase n=1 Tax=Polaromonas sp. (strain JS666 / ATCC BAA-500) TaxID=296591 RepID=UPI00088FB8BF|nr:alpha/beta fold hydrolase [Polaromonas sp. JS666]SDM39151.1 Pimeloyl-ACP methyl ester carboxylesterase [Polaromonas sp. JS666]
MADTSPHIPKRLALVAGELPAPGTLPEPYPYETVEPHRQGFVERDGVRTWYGQFGESGPWLAFAPIYQIANTYLLRGVVPWLSQHFRVAVMDLRGNGRSDRPATQAGYSFDHYYADFVAVLDALDIDRTAVVGISATAMTAIRLAHEQPQRVSHLISAGGWVNMRMEDPAMHEAAQQALLKMRGNWPAFLDGFFGAAFNEPHSTKPLEDAVVRNGWVSSGDTVAMGRTGWLGNDVRELAKGVRCPTLVIHGDNDRIAPLSQGETVASLVPGARMLKIEGGGHLLAGRDPIAFARAVRDFVGAAPTHATWVRGMARKRKALFISSAIGLGHVQRDLAIAREMRAQQPDLQIDWFTVQPASTYLEREGERVHPICKRLGNESRHFESQAGEHDLQAFFALRTMDEVMALNFLVFAELMKAEHYDIVIGDESWEVDYHYHENPELKRQPFVFLTDFVGCLPMEEGNEREAFLCADRNADDIEHVARYPWIRDRAIFVGNEDDVPDLPFGPGLPDIRDWTKRNFAFTGYALPFDPKSLADTDALRARHGYARDEKLVIAAVGGTSVGGSLLHRIAQTFPLMKKQVPELRMVLVAGPRLPRDAFPTMDGLDVLPYVHKLFEHLACSDLALVQGGLSTCMELVATRRPFLRFPLERHFEQCIHVTNRMRNYCAECTVRFSDLTVRELADKALQTMHAPVSYKPVETDGAARAARHILAVMENREWAAA